MAMNKKEQAAIAEAEVNRALRWSDYETEKDVPKPSDGYVNGWSFNSYNATVYQSWSGSTAHGQGCVVDGKRPASGSQNGVKQCSTKEKALKAMRRELERAFAQRLAGVDRMISAGNDE